jgi:hypothetical protein
VQALLDYLPAAQVPTGATANLTAADGRTLQIPLGSITGSASFAQTNWQGSARYDYRFNDKHMMTGRYMVNDDMISGTGQVTPPGLTTISPARAQSATQSFNSTFSPNLYNEFRVSYQRLNTLTNSSNPDSETNPLAGSRGTWPGGNQRRGVPHRHRSGSQSAAVPPQ